MKAKWLILIILIIGLSSTIDVYSEEYAPGEILVKFKTTQNTEESLLQSLRTKINATKIKKFEINNVYHLKLDPGTSVESAVASAYTDPNVEYAEPNYIININTTPNDPSFGSLYGLNNTGQTGGTADSDIDAPETWDIIRDVPDNIIIAVIDTGVDYNHPDIAANIWTGPNGEHGYDFYNYDADPMDDHNHGTHVAGTIAAVGNNSVGVTGVAWRAKIMAVKFLGASGSGSTSGAISSIQYAVSKGAKILSNSWGGGGYSQALKDAITASHNAGTLFVAAAGNSGTNNDTNPHYPSSYDVENIIAVAATDHNDNLAYFSCYGPTSVDCAAPGVSILSTVRNGGYASYSGTSMATPHVSGICALVWAYYPQSTNLQIKARILSTVDIKSSLQDKMVSNGRANLYKALTVGSDTTPPAAVMDLAVTGTTYKSATLIWTAVGDDNLVGTASQYDIRYSTAIIDENNFNQANTVTGTPIPKQSGTQETFTIQGLSPNTTYYIALKVLDEWGNTSGISNVVSVKTGTATILFQDRMENGLNGWTISGTDGSDGPSLWHLSQKRFNSTTTSWYYGNEKKGNFDTGKRNYGSITSPTIDLTTATSTDLIFNYWRSVESYPYAYDVLKAEVSYDNGSTWTTLWSKSSTTPSELTWMSSSYITLQPGGQIRIRFSFDTGDAIANNFEGIYIDDLEIVGIEPADSTPPAAVADLAVQKNSSTYATLQWTSPGDDGNIGTALSYDIRYSTSNISTGNWKNATQVIGEPRPQKAGNIESFTVTGLTPNKKYYFAIKSMDNASNESGLSNAINITTLSPPDAVVNPAQIPLVTLLPNSTTTKTLTISNTGDSPLEFSLTDIKGNGLNATVVQAIEEDVPQQVTDANAEYVEGELLVKTKEPPDLSQVGAEILQEFKEIGVYHIRLNGGMSVPSAIEQLKNDPNVIYAEPNYVAEAFLIPNDPRFTELWGMNNTGQTGGTSDADIDAPEAWNYFTGTGAITVAVIDTGVDYNHPDLASNVIAGGYDFYNNDPDPMDDHGHGTHVSGTIGGIGNNGVGVAGVNWTTKILPIKFLGAGGGGSYDGAINSVLYSVQKGCKVSSNSWGGSGYSQALKDAIDYGRTAIGQLFIAAAGNSASNADQYPLYPAAYDLPNIISVAATDHNDNLAYFSNWGPVSVDLGAPGVSILSTLPNNNYAAWSGTSMATPHVSGAAALVWSQNAGMTYDQVKSRLLSTVDPKSSLSGKCVSGGRLNVYNAIQKENDPTPPANVADLAVIDSTFKSVTLTWTAVGDDGNTGTATQYDLRYSTSPITDFNTATQVGGEPAPAPAGSKESVIVTGLDFNKTYYFALKVMDNVGNWSGLSNVPSGTTKVPTVVFQDDMENGKGGWTGSWSQTTESSHSASMSWTDSPGGYYGNNQTISLVSPTIDLTKLATASLEFWHKYEIEKDFDFGYIEGSHDNGVTWIQIKSFTGKQSTWTKEILDLTSSCMGKTLKLRFKVVTDSSVTYDGWYIDDVVILGSATASGWLKPDITSGIVQPGQSTIITLTYDAAGLALGSYSTQLNISTDDPDNYLITVLASLIVEVTPPSAPPNITITQPSDGALVKTPQINVSGTIDYKYSLVTVNGVAAVVNNNTWGTTITLVEGQNTITVVATNSLGNTTKSIKVTLDTTPPTVTIKQPADGSKTKESSITVSGSVSDSVGVAGVTVNSQTATINGNNFTISGIILQEGTNTITVQGIDTAGNTKIASITVIKDTTPPAVTISSPADGSTTLISPTTIQGTVDDSEATITINGSTATVTNGTFSGNATLSVGTNTITVSASDTLGNTSTKSITVTYVLGPRIEVTPSTIPQVTLGVGQTTTQTMTIKNIGDQDLVYSIGVEETTSSSLPLQARGTHAGRGSEAISYPDSETPPKPELPEHHPTRLLVKFKEGIAGAESENIHSLVGAQTISTYDEIGIHTVQILSNMDLKEAIATYMQSGMVEYAEYDYKVQALVTPNDPMYGSLWGMPKIQAPQAWDYTKGGDIIVGVIDTGVDYNHQDLTSNMWHNPGEIPGNGADDDGNGYVDDYYGFNAINNSGNPMDDHGHGTHVSGTIAGIGNNGVGVVGVTWTGTKIMALKFLSSGGSGYISDALKCLQYANNKGARCTSNSWGGGGYSQAFKDAITNAEQKGYLFVAAAGNSGSDNDSSPMYPASYNNANIISVAATDSSDNKTSWSSYGATTCDLGAPGAGILSCLPGNNYASWSGTSMATPHVSGACALVWGQNLNLTGSQVKQKIMNAVDPNASLAGKCVTNGRLNVYKAIEIENDTTPPATITNLSIAGITFQSVSLTWTAPGDDGNSGTASSYDIRYSTSAITSANFSSAIPATGVPVPKSAGSAESFTISGLNETTNYYFAIKAIDNAANYGSISNVPQAMTTNGTTIFTDNMESGISKWVAESPWALVTNEYKSASHSWHDSPGGNYGDNVTTRLTSIAIDLSKYNTARLTFWHKYSLEPDYDYGYLLISTDNGSTWTLLNTYNGGGVMDSWSQESIDISNYCGSGKTNVKIRFMLVTDYSVTYDGWYIDDVNISGSGKWPSWLAAYPFYATLTPGQSNTITLTYNSNNLSGGTYSADLKISSNDATNPLVTKSASLVVDATPPATPTGLTATSGDTVVNLSWTANTESDLAGYNLYVKGSGSSSTNIASLATISVSSEYSSNYSKAKLIDGIIGQWGTGEWASKGEMTPSAQFNWSGPVVINKVTLYDRSNPYDKVLNGVLEFSDGSSVQTGELPNDGTKKELTFTSRTVSWAKFRVTSGTGYNVGLSEFEVYGYFASSTNIAPDAAISVSSEYSGNYGKAKLIDGIIGKWDTGEWASKGEVTPWAQCNWSGPVMINKIILYDRSNPYDKILNAVLEFSDGSSIQSGELPNDGTKKEITFTTRTVSWVKFRVTSGAGPNVGLSEFEVYSNAYSKRNSTLITTTSYSDTGLTNGTNYTYVVTAVDKYGNESGHSSKVTSKPKDSIPPAAPTGLSASDPGTGDVVLSWAANTESDIAGYNVYRGGIKTNTSLVSALTYTDTGLTKGTSYTYTVKAQDTSDNEGTASSSANVIPGAPNAPAGVTASSGDSLVDLTWTANTEADLAGYNVYLKGTGTSNTASNATISVSSEYSSNYDKAKLVDGIIGKWDTGEWASKGETTPSAKLEWSSPVTINKVALYDRSNPYDKILNGILEFSDGTSVQTGELPNDGSMKEITFTAKTVSWVKFTVTSGAGYNVGLSEMEVYTAYSKRNSSLITTNSYQDTGLTNGTNYIYVVTAVDKHGNESSYSNEASATPKEPPDKDSDAIYNVFDSFPLDPQESEDTDSDGIGNNADTDDDNDGVPDTDDDLPYNPAKSKAKHTFTVAASMPTSWDTENAWKSFLQNLDVLDEVNLYWYEMQQDGSLTTYTGAKDINLVKLAQDNNIIVIPYISNKFDPARVSAVINNMDTTISHIQNIVNEVVNNNYDGINIDYESCYADDRDAFTSFIQNLATALHNKGKMLSVSIHAKTYEPGDWNGAKSQDWQALANVVDKFRVMSYDYSWKTSPAGPIAPVNWLNDVYSFAITIVDPKKLIMGIPFYGYDWIGTNGASKTWLEVQDIINTNNITTNWNSSAQEPYFEYYNNDQLHTVYFENSDSISYKLNIFYNSNVKGISIWRIGSEDPNNWDIIRNLLGISPTPSPNNKLVVSCLGDSITHGYPYILQGTENTYPSQLQGLLDSVYGLDSCQVNNYGISGIKADQLLALMETLDWANGDPDFVLLKIGGNDLAQEALPDGSNLTQVINQTVSEVQAIVNLIKAHTNSNGSTPKVIVSTFIPVQDTLKTIALSLYNNKLKSTLAGTDLIITTNWDDFYDSASGKAYASLMYDELHPNSSGYGIMAENWFEAINSLISSTTVKNVILLIGDGMGPEQVKSGKIFSVGPNGTLSMETLTYSGQVTTNSLSGVTDSAAASTAIATGYKVYNGYLSQALDGTEYKTVLEYARILGKRTGLVTTTEITHATPAGFGAHTNSRSNWDDIAKDYIYGSQPNILFGGGKAHFIPSTESGSARTDNGLIDDAQAQGYTYVNTATGLYLLDMNSEDKVLGLFNLSHLTYEYDKPSPATEPDLSEMTLKALDLLEEDPDGFFLMVEGGKIDHACHAHDITRSVYETREFDDSVKTVLDWAVNHPDTLILITADHETGGLQVLSGNYSAGQIPNVTWSTTGHTGTNVPIWGKGPGSTKVSNTTVDNTDIFGTTLDAMIKKQ